jgi:hypothetical protein
LTPQSRKRARFDFARNEFSQKSGKTNAPTIGLDGKTPLLDRLPERSSRRCWRNGMIITW